eukprot:CAMPEP_0194286584 /NCGR_PEP_ID=MMETSP0169-20130528/32830_1 /TAXON_ID=218684 /ORGANISM="Corethron pennatum, Strain L29A3" /LENGTH=118 /DNA_ID=CAMNT_0039033061 /DNA_START=97 /DNA_END=449 /DNA_ORIENTATION=-
MKLSRKKSVLFLLIVFTIFTCYKEENLVAHALKDGGKEKSPKGGGKEKSLKGGGKEKSLHGGGKEKPLQGGRQEKSLEGGRKEKSPIYDVRSSNISGIPSKKTYKNPTFSTEIPSKAP